MVWCTTRRRSQCPEVLSRKRTPSRAFVSCRLPAGTSLGAPTATFARISGPTRIRSIPTFCWTRSPEGSPSFPASMPSAARRFPLGLRRGWNPSDASTTGTASRGSTFSRQFSFVAPRCWALRCWAAGSSSYDALPEVSRGPRKWAHLPVPFGSSSGAVVGLLQFLDVELDHFEHGVHHAFRLICVLVLQQLTQNSRDDLPRHPELVPEPAALLRFPAPGELSPQVIDFLLRLAIHQERNGGCELELRAAVQCRKLLSIEHERHDHHRTLPARPRLSVTRHVHDLRVLENGDIELGGLLGLAVEPQERMDRLHLAVLLDL